MQKYRMFENLLGLRALEINKVKSTEVNPDDSSSDIELGKPPGSYRFNRHKSIPVENEETEKSKETISSVLRDGDEFVFKLASFDKWIQVIINLELKGSSPIKFNTRCEMRVVGYFPNSHFFNIIQRKAIDYWNENIHEKRNKNDYYVLKDISFINRKTILQRVDSQAKEPEIMTYAKSARNRLNEVGKDVKKERAKININKKNKVDKQIDETKRVDETFDFDG